MSALLKMSVALGALVVATAGVGGIAFTKDQYLTTARPAAAQEVTPGVEADVATVISRSVTDWQSYSGRLQAVDDVEIRPLVSGTIVETFVKEGGLVRKGDPLFTIDPAPYRAAVDHAAAQLAAAQARVKFSKVDAARAEKLVKGQTIGTREYEERTTAYGEAEARLLAAQAALEAAKVNLGYTKILAPVSGLVSRAELTIGNVVSAGANAPVLATLVSVSPIYASFDVDEQTYLRYLRHDAKNVPVLLGLADEDGYSRQGEIVTVDNRLNVGNATIRVRASFDNPDGTLMPGLYARIKVGGGKPHEAVMVDDAAIGTDQAKKFVYVVDGNNKAQYREIQVGELQDGLRVVLNGLAAGERIVVSGIQRVRPNNVIYPTTVPMDKDANLATNTNVGGTALDMTAPAEVGADRAGR